MHGIILSGRSATYRNKKNPRSKVERGFFEAGTNYFFASSNDAPLISALDNLLPRVQQEAFSLLQALAFSAQQAEALALSQVFPSPA